MLLPLTRLYIFAPPAYLLVGCILMLMINEILDGAVTKKEFLLGLVLWPVLLLGWICGFFRYLVIAAWGKLRG